MAESRTFPASSDPEGKVIEEIYKCNERMIDMTDVIKNDACWLEAFPAPGADPKNKTPDPNAQVIQKSWGRYDMSFPAKHGLVAAVLDAYNGHNTLTLKPDHFWTAIMTQFSFYVTANSEALRDRLVDFEGKKELTIYAGGSLFTADFGEIANRMVDEQIAKNIKDPSLRDWVIPSFTTTEPKDRIVASVCFMSTLQNFFSYKFCLECGIPQVTLEGTRQDWVDLRAKIDRLLEFNIAPNNYMSLWHGFLVKICEGLIESFDNGRAKLAFWDNCCDFIAGGSGPSFLAGWISSFAVFKATGEWQGRCEMEDDPFSSEQVTMDFPVIDAEDLPSGVCKVPVTVDDNGAEYDCFMFAGQFGYDADNSYTGIIPRNDWCIATVIKCE